jgi:hypothetical protein
MAQDIEAGHGNGGKAFMVRGSASESFIETCCNRLRTKMGFRNDDRDVLYLPAYVREGGLRLEDLRESNPRKRLDTILRDFGIQFKDIPETAKELFVKREAFTAVVIRDVREWQGFKAPTLLRAVRSLPNELATHSQAALSIETSSVWVIADGVLLTKKPLNVEYPEPFPGLENIEPIPVPHKLKDPRTGDMIETGDGDKMLYLHTSAKQLRMSDTTKALNIIRVRNDRNIVGYWTVADLNPLASSAFIYGELHLPIMRGRHLVGSDRVGFADTSLVRAVQLWVAEKVQELGKLIQRAHGKETRPEERNRMNEILHQFRDLMRKFLEPESTAGDMESDALKGGGEGPKPKPPEAPRWGSRIDRIILEPGRTSIAMAYGSRIPLDFRCYEVSPNGLLPIRNPEVTLAPDKNGLLKLHPDKSLEGLAEGRTTIRITDKSSTAKSEPIEVEIIACRNVELVGSETPLLQSQRIEILYSFQTTCGDREDILLDASVDESGMGRMSRNGYFTAGYQEGNATIRVRYGPGQFEHATLQIAIGDDLMPVRGQGSGSDVPQILICGSEAPGLEQYPRDQRTHQGGEHHPTIIEDPAYGAVVWLNPTSKESMRVRHRGGPTGVGGISTVTFTQFLALKCFDILKRLWVRQQLANREVTEREFTRRFAEAETECAAFIDAAYDLAHALCSENKGNKNE